MARTRLDRTEALVGRSSSSTMVLWVMGTTALRNTPLPAVPVLIRDGFGEAFLAYSP